MPSTRLYRSACLLLHHHNHGHRKSSQVLGRRGFRLHDYCHSVACFAFRHEVGPKQTLRGGHRGNPRTPGLHRPAELSPGILLWLRTTEEGTDYCLRKVSHKLDSVIIETASLQYKIELGMAGYEDGSSSSNNVISRLAAIRRERCAWKYLYLRHVKAITIPSQEWIEARSHKDVISGRVPDLPKQLDLVYLGSGISDQDRIKHVEFDTRFDAHYIDPGQDLVVLASLTQTLDAA